VSCICLRQSKRHLPPCQFTQTPKPLVGCVPTFHSTCAKHSHGHNLLARPSTSCITCFECCACSTWNAASIYRSVLPSPTSLWGLSADSLSAFESVLLLGGERHLVASLAPIHRHWHKDASISFRHGCGRCAQHANELAIQRDAPKPPDSLVHTYKTIFKF
jgi:hypothetical protein